MTSEQSEAEYQQNEHYLTETRTETGCQLTVVVTSDQTDGGFVAEVREVPGCMSQGETVLEALTNVAHALTEATLVAKPATPGFPTDTVPDAAGRIAELERAYQDLAVAYHKKVHGSRFFFGLCPNLLCAEARDVLAGGYVDTTVRGV